MKAYKRCCLSHPQSCVVDVDLSWFACFCVTDHLYFVRAVLAIVYDYITDAIRVRDDSYPVYILAELLLIHQTISAFVSILYKIDQLFVTF